MDLLSLYENIYKMEYQAGMIDKPTVHSYVALGILSADGYRRITGDDYSAGTATD